MPAYALMLSHYYYAQNYAGIIRKGLPPGLRSCALPPICTVEHSIRLETQFFSVLFLDTNTLCSMHVYHIPK